MVVTLRNLVLGCDGCNKTFADVNEYEAHSKCCPRDAKPFKELCDVVISTKNNEKTIKMCMSSLKYIPINKVIIVDGGSTDMTLDIIEKFSDRYDIDIKVSPHAGIGTSRYMGALRAKTRYIIYVDSDMQIQPEWWQTVSHHVLNPKFGSIQARDRPPHKLWGEYCGWKTWRLFLNFIDRKYGTRGMGQVIVEREKIVEFEMMSKMVMFEDGYFFDWLTRKKGLLNILVWKHLALHYKHDILGRIRSARKAGEAYKQLRGNKTALGIAMSSLVHLKRWKEFIVESSPSALIDLRLPLFLELLVIASLYGALRGGYFSRMPDLVPLNEV